PNPFLLPSSHDHRHLHSFPTRRSSDLILNIAPTIPNDKPIGGAIFPVLFFNVAAVLGVLSVSLYSLGVWNIDLSRRKDKADLGALVTLVTGGLLLWYVPLAFFFVVASIVYLLAVNIE